MPALRSSENEDSTAVLQASVGRNHEIRTRHNHSHDIQNSSCADSEEPLSLEGILYIRKGRSAGNTSWSWKKRFVVLSFKDSGSIAVFDVGANSTHTRNAASQPTSVLHTVYSRLHRSVSTRNFAHAPAGELVMDITGDLPWIAKDIKNDPSTFVVEISTVSERTTRHKDKVRHVTPKNIAPHLHTYSTKRNNDSSPSDSDDAFEMDSDSDDDTITLQDDRNSTSCESLDFMQPNLSMDLETARRKGKPLRIYFLCDTETNEKALWLKALSSVGRLSSRARDKKSLLTSFTSSMSLGSSRVRSKANERIARDARHLDLSIEPCNTDTVDLTDNVERLARGGKSRTKDTEYRVLPSYAYPHRWLTKAEMREEMVLPSEFFHDLRVPDCRLSEIGSLRVEVLQCLGLPKLDRGSDSDAVVYLVCGSYAFSTDVIFNRTNPMWLRKSRRACDIPLFHGYARLFVGVFDDEPRRVKDDFAGRVVVDLARLRPRSTYDITLPLRLSTHVYSRRRRGAVRLRFTLNWKSERAPMMSYLPKTFRIPLPQHSKPNMDTTVMCSDQKAFRNIAITVHGAHLPGKFTFNQMRAAIREVNFTRKFVVTGILRIIRETRQWKNPAMSAFVFLAWMHCVFANAFSLVPAYTMLCFLLLLMRTYASYCTDAPTQRGFLPPSWEELFMALLKGGDPKSYSIEPLDLGIRSAAPLRHRSTSSSGTGEGDSIYSQYQVSTHKPKGKKLLQALGFLPDASNDPNDDHLEFPFANGKIYPRFSVRECLVLDTKTQNTASLGSSFDDGGSTIVSGLSEIDPHRTAMMPRFPDMDLQPLQRMIRKDLSGTKDHDEEEKLFNTRRVVMSQARKASMKMTKTTGLDYVVRPIHSGISTGVGHVSSGVGHMSSVAGNVTSHVMRMPSGMRNRHNMDVDDADTSSRQECGVVCARCAGNLLGPANSATDESGLAHDLCVVCSEMLANRSNAYSDSYFYGSNVGIVADTDADEKAATKDMDELDVPFESPNFEAAVEWKVGSPDQDIDIQNKGTGKKLTDDLAEVKDKVHELTWHLFDDHTYVIKNPDALFFGDTKKKKSDPTKQLDKYLHMGQYSNSNPFVARVGMYVEPIIGSTYSILCLFRAGFNVLTWRDPMLTFWVSFICGLSSIVLFFFPWRIFLFLVGIWIVGPQNWAIRILRERGHLPPARINVKGAREEGENFEHFPLYNPVFTKHSRQTGNEPRIQVDKDCDPRTIHHVVVPYSPLCHQRCNDWPPEAEFAQVKRNPQTDENRRVISEAYPFGKNPFSGDETNLRNREAPTGQLQKRRLGRTRLNSSTEELFTYRSNRRRTHTSD